MSATTKAQTRPDPNVCPGCGAEGTLRELANRPTWQPVTLAYPEPGGQPQYGPSIPEAVDYESFDYGDDAFVTGFDCSACGDEWPTMYALAHAQRLAHALTQHRDHWERRAERLSALDDAGRFDRPQEIDAAAARAEAFSHALAIVRGNGEA